MGFKVIIVGGSVAGLSLANMLEKFDIDYVLLEAYPQIAPQVGASIGLLPNGLRILDQLGCYERILEVAEDCHYLQGSLRGPGGVVVGSPAGASASLHLEKRVGYLSLFIDRQMLLQVLHDNVKHKEQLLTGKRVTQINLLEDGVEVQSEDGSIFHGDIVVGADGIHSKVRAEMWRHGMEKSPGYFPIDEESQVPVSTRCIFGISKRPARYKHGEQQMVHYKGWTYLVLAAPGDRTYWFLFDGLPETTYGKNSAKYTKDDEATLAKAHFKDQITETTTFGDIYEKKIMSTLVPLEEHVFKRWHFDRIITIGDSAHKIDPMSGQGGNGAIESAALLVNALMEKLKASTGKLSSEQVESALAEVHTHRFERAQRLVREANTLQLTLSQRRPFSGLIMKYLAPLVGPNAFVDVVIPICVEATKIQGIPVPERVLFVPFEDELPVKPLKNAALLTIPWAMTSALFGLFLLATSNNTVAKLLRGYLEPETTAIDGQVLLFMINLVPLLVVWLIEAHRYGNSLSPLSWPIIYSLAYKYLGVQTIMPLFCLSSVLFSTKTITGRHVAPRFAESILPAVILGYIMPTAALLSPIKNIEKAQFLTTYWTATPLLSAIIVKGMASLWTSIRSSKSQTQKTGDSKGSTRNIANRLDESDMAMYQNADIIPLKNALGSALALVSLAQLCFVAGRITPLISDAIISPVTLQSFQQANTIYTLSSLVYSTYTAWNLRTLGFATSLQAIAAGSTSILATYLLGPAIPFAGISFWRESVIVSMSTRVQ
ncbi:FAD binding domain-containing protein [Phlyctema vagabunda]|uniref:FAD binding domain-containing protein n=1 Tax=Phlyctema vagabunda TaxID=108571 RepID=A0ABR4P611_9HELO